jgi:predicted transposase/invertase (TIGR01784 family)
LHKNTAFYPNKKKIVQKIKFFIPLHKKLKGLIMAKKTNKVSKRSDFSTFINPRTDFGFKKLFGYENILVSFLNTILPETIVDIEYLSQEQLGYKKENRKAVYDISCKTITGKHLIVEMQAAPQPHFAERALLYASYPIVSQAPKGKVSKINKKGETIKVSWDYSLAGVYIISILNFNLFTEEKAKTIIIEHVKLVRQEANIIFSDKLELVTIELLKFKKKKEELTSLQDKWLYSLQNMEKLQECPEQMDEDIFKELYENAKIDNLTEEEMETYKKSVLEYDDVILAVNYAEERGMEVGEKRGEKRGIKIGKNQGIEIGEKRGIEIGEKQGIEIGEKRGIEIGKNMLVRNCYAHNLSIEQIAEFTGLTTKQVSDILTDKSEK